MVGKPPLADCVGNLRQILYRVQRGEVPPPRDQTRRAKALEAICLKAMALDPAARYGSARLLSADIEHWLADEPVSVLPDTPLERVVRWTRRHRALALAAAVASRIGHAGFGCCHGARQSAAENCRPFG